MDRINTNAEYINTPPLRPPGSTQADPEAAGVSILRRPLRMKLHIASALVVDRDGESHQERLLAPTETLKEMLRRTYAQAGLELIALDYPGETPEVEVDVDVWAAGILPCSDHGTSGGG